MHVTVQSGSNAGWRRVRERPAWQCCNQTISGQRYSCPICHTARPAKAAARTT